MIRATIRCPTMPVGVKGINSETVLEYKKVKQALNNPILKLFVSEQKKQLVNEVESQGRRQDEYAQHNDILFNELSYKISKITAVLEANGTITVSRPDDFAAHRAQIESLLQARNISYSFLNGKFLLSEPEHILLVANAISQLDVTWTNDPTTKATDGHFVITHCDSTKADLEQIIAEKGLEIAPDRRDITSKFSLPNATEGAPMYEDVDDVLEPLTQGELKKLKATRITNEYRSRLP